MNLIIRPSGGINRKPKHAFALQLRSHNGPGEVEYYTIAHVSEEMARDIISAGPAEWLLGDPAMVRATDKEGKEDERQCIE